MLKSLGYAMKIKNNVFLGVSIIITIIILLSWEIFLPTKIIAVHNDREFSSVLIKHPPLTDTSKIEWWLRNKENFERNFGIPRPASDGFFSVTFWDFGDGYKVQQKYDQLCFNDMSTQKKCIDKNIIFTIENDINGRVNILIYDGDNYIIKTDGSFEKYNSNITISVK